MRLLLPALISCGGGDGGPSDGGTAPDGDTDVDTDSDSDSDGDVPGGIGPTDLITPVPYPGLRVEIDWVTGKMPDAEALDRVRDHLAELVAGGWLVKPTGVDVVLDEEVPALGAGVHTFAELDAALRASAGASADGSIAVVHALYADGSYEGDEGSSRVLGFAYGGNSLVILADNLADGCADLTGLVSEQTCELAEATVLAHELGHLWGLVDNGLPMVADHKDPAHGDHDADPECLMYWTVERTEVFDALSDAILGGESAVKPLDPACLADMAAANGR
jgi:hypothetical protein